MSISRINVDGVETLISIGINDDEIAFNDLRCDDTLELDEVIKEVSKITDEKKWFN